MSTKRDASDGSVIDLGGRTLRIANGGRIDVGSGLLEIFAGALVVDANGALRARGSNDNPGGAILVAAQSVIVGDSIDADGDFGGTIDLRAETVTVAGSLRADGLGGESVGGNITVDAGAVTIGGEVTVKAGSAGTAGRVAIAARDLLQLSGLIDAATGDGVVLLVTGLPLDVEIPTRIDEPATPGPSAPPRLDLTGVVSVRGNGQACGGQVTLASRGDVYVAGDIDASGGSGGYITFAAGLQGAGNVIVDARSTLDMSARAAESYAGDLQFIALGDGLLAGHLRMDGQLLLRGPRDGGAGTIYGDLVSGDIRSQTGARYLADGGGGGSLYLTAGIDPWVPTGTIDVDAEIDLSTLSADEIAGCVTLWGRETYLKGSLLIPGEAAGVEINGTESVRVEATVDAGGDGSSLTLFSERGAVRVAGSLTVNAPPDAETESGIAVDACTIDIEATAELNALGSSGQIELTGADETQIRGVLRAGQSNVIRHGLGRPPIITGTTDPAVTLVVDPSLLTCAEQNVATATPTETPTPSATDTHSPSPDPTATVAATATSTPSPTDAIRCPGDCGGDGMVSISDLILSVNIALGANVPSDCQAVDPNSDGDVVISELIAAVNAALEGC